MCKHHQINPILCIIPPHMIEELAANGSPRQAEKAKNTLEQSNTLRSKRIEVAKTSVKPALIIGNKHREIYNLEFGVQLKQNLVRSEGDPESGDPAVDEAYEGSGATYDLYYDIFERNSIDNNGMHLISNVHFSQGYDNAFWNGVQMVYGDGDEDLPVEERIFNRFTASVDIIGHELTHGVVQYEANLVYSNQAGALNESFADVFGSLVKQRIHNQKADEADWLIGAELLTENVNGEGIRSLKAPGTAYNDSKLGKDPQPGHMNYYKTMTADSGGVHINSGIPNKAFYNVAIEIGGYAWEKAGKIWYVTLRDKLKADSDFQAAADLLYETAGELFGENSPEQKAVRKGWRGVGIELTIPEPPEEDIPPVDDDNQSNDQNNQPPVEEEEKGFFGKILKWFKKIFS